MANDKFVALQSLRGIAALLVVIYHVVIMTQFEIATDAPLVWLRDLFSRFGSVGVEIFFVLSGFIISYSVYEKSQLQSARDFLTKRLTRIYPPYLLYSMLALGLYVLSRSHFASEPIHWDYLIKSLLLIPVFDEQGKFFPVLIVGWTLMFEAYFYLLFALALVLRLNYWQSLLFFLMLFLAGQGWALNGCSDSTICHVSGSRYLWFFFGGALLYGVHRYRLSKTPSFFYLTFIVSGICWFSVLFGGVDAVPHKVLVFLLAHASVALALSPMINGVTAGRWLRPLSSLGDASYTLYLYHWLAIVVISAFWKREVLVPAVEHSLWAASALVVLLVLGSLVLYSKIEVPLTRARTYKTLYSRVLGFLQDGYRPR